MDPDNPEGFYEDDGFWDYDDTGSHDPDSLYEDDEEDENS